MKILVLFKVKDDADLTEVKDYLVEEERWAWGIYLKGDLREHYESDLPTPAISILEMESIAAAQALMQDLPLLKAGLITAEYHELRPFRNWEVLFKNEERQGLAE
ncbi:MAG: hypothetical protein QNJ22_06660 [Desulfosarcinaceae bacterium]|nr:hypothetical protein [Desulfosarcinaceae bacterium]